MKCYAVIDTNVLVSALLSSSDESATVQILERLLEYIIKFGIPVEPTPTGVQLPDMKDLPFYEIVMEQQVGDTYLITGNLKHFPKHTYIVTARQMLDILNEII